jgi:hypothetical protein
MSLSQIAQDDFSAGTLRGTAPDVQPGVGVSSALNGLLNDDGDVYRRGGDKHVGVSVGSEILWLWTGFLSGAPVELVATRDTIFANGVSLVTGLTIDGPMQVAAFENALYLPTGTVIRSAGGVLTAGVWARPANIDAAAPMHVANVIGRLAVGCLNRVAFSGAGTPEVFAATDYHALGGGVLTKGLFALTDTLLVFTNFGLWAISNMAFNLTDDAGNVQQSLSLLVPGLSLIHEAGLAAYQERVVAPCIDRIYLVDAINPPVAISDSIAVDWNGYVAQGMLPGGAKVFNSTLFLPVRLPPLVVPGEGWTPGAIVTLLVCRLNRPVRGRVMYFPWSDFGGHPATMRHFDVSLTQDTPRLLGGGQDGTITDLTGVFTLDASNTLDADATAPTFYLETRDFPTGQGQPNHLRRIRLRYTAKGSGQILAAYSSDPGHEDWVELDPQPLTDGKEPLSWWLPSAVRVRFVRVRFETPDAVEGLVVHRIELNTRSAAHAR